MLYMKMKLSLSYNYKSDYNLSFLYFIAFKEKLKYNKNIE